MRELVDPLISLRAPSVFKGLYKLRGNESWGHLPPNDAMFTFFDSIKTHIGRPITQILEFGTNVGFSAMMQLQTNPDSHLTTFDITRHNIRLGRSDIWPNNDEYLTAVTPTALLKILYVDRFEYKIDSSANIERYPSLMNKKFDYVFVDGAHDFGSVVGDMDNAISKLDTDWVLVDNMDLSPVRRGVDMFIDNGSIELVAEHQYAQIRMNTDELFNDRLHLYKIVK
jgi:hypothetical protein